MAGYRMGSRARSRLLVGCAALATLVACAPAVAPSPTAAPPAPTVAPKPTLAPEPVAKPTEAPGPAPKATEAPAAQPAPKAEAKPAEKAAQESVEAFYKGKTVKIITGYTPGGQYDAWSRLLARYMPRYLPGSPTMVVENMAGAASLRAANHVYNAAPKDGTVIGNISQSMILQQIIGLEGIEFDMQQFQWLGAVANVTTACLAREETGVKSLADTLPPAHKQVVAGSSGPGSHGYDYPLLMNRLLNTHFKLVSGYPANAEVRLAIEKNEVDGYCTPWEVLKPTIQPWIESGQPRFAIFVQFPAEGSKHPEMADVPVFWDFVKNPDDKAMFKMLSLPEQFFWPFMVPPGVPAERVQALRQAMAQAFKDPELIADATKAKYTMNPVPGERIQQFLKDILALPESVKARFKELMKPLS